MLRVIYGSMLRVDPGTECGTGKLIRVLTIVKACKALHPVLAPDNSGQSIFTFANPTESL